MNTNEQNNRAKGALFGILVADALGIPYVTSAPGRIPARRWRVLGDTPEYPLPVEASETGHFERAHRGTPEGTWGEAGALALARAEALLVEEFTGGSFRRGVDENVDRWLVFGEFTPDGRVFDASGFGSPASVVPIAILGAGWTDTEDLIERGCREYDENAARGADRAETRETWGLLCGLLAKMIEYGESWPVASASSMVSRAFEIVRSAKDFEDAVQTAIEIARSQGLRGSVWTRDLIPVTGAIAGAKFGFDGIPRAMLRGLKGKPIASLVSSQLLVVRGSR